MICDLRDFTKISDNGRATTSLTSDGYLTRCRSRLRDMAGNTEIIATAAPFFAQRASSLRKSAACVAEARQAMVALNEKNSETGRAPLNYGIASTLERHVRQYRVADRLDFTVIGPAVNMARVSKPSPNNWADRCCCPRIRRFCRKRFRLERVGDIRSASSTTQSSCLRITAECRR